MRLVLGKEISVHAARILKVYIETLMGSEENTSQMVSAAPHSLKALSLQWLRLWEWRAEGNAHSKDWEGYEEPPIAWVLPTGQPAVMSS